MQSSTAENIIVEAADEVPIFPAQFFNDPAHHKSGEKNLMQAVLIDAIEQFRKHACSHTPEGREEYEEALAYFKAPQDNWPCSFRNICATLDMDGDRLLRLLLEERERMFRSRYVG